MMLLLWSCLTIWWRVALGDHQEGARATSVLHNNPPATFSVTFIWFSPGISDGTAPEKRKNGVFKISPEILTPLHPQCESSVLHPPATAATSSWRTDSETAVSLRAASREQLLLLFKKQLFQTASPSSPSLSPLICKAGPVLRSSTHVANIFDSAEKLADKIEYSRNCTH